ncbi:MAG: porin family protein [Saprospiraceae bacterium]|nr:porin family protein [Saprospiraceae bacterium]
MNHTQTPRTYLISLTLAVCSVLSLPAAMGQFTFTPQAGLNINWINASSEISGLSMESATYTSFGGRFGYIFLDRIEVEVGVLYNQRGGQMINTNPGADDEKWVFKYLDIQPQLEYKIWKQLGVYAGGYYGIHFRSDRNVDGTWEEDVPDRFDEADLGISLGLRAYLGRIFLQGQYDIGMTTLDNQLYTDMNGTTTEVDFKNRTIQLAVGYHFVF